MLIIAIDLGKFNSVACLYNTQTQKQQFETLATDRGFFETLFKTYNPDLVVVEACGPSGCHGVYPKRWPFKSRCQNSGSPIRVYSVC